MAQSLDQQRASYAWTQVGKHQKDLGGGFSDYVNLAKAAPALIMGNGLMQTLAFYQAKAKDKGKGKSHHHALLGDVLGWLHRSGLVPKGFGDAMKKLAGASTHDYLAATEEALEILRWIRQLADAAKTAAKTAGAAV